MLVVGVPVVSNQLGDQEGIKSTVGEELAAVRQVEGQVDKPLQQGLLQAKHAAQ